MESETWIRTCQECGNRQVDKPPKEYGVDEMSEAYRYRKCKKCKSEALDYGSYQPVDPKTLKRIEKEEEE